MAGAVDDQTDSQADERAGGCTSDDERRREGERTVVSTILVTVGEGETCDDDSADDRPSTHINRPNPGGLPLGRISSRPDVHAVVARPQSDGGSRVRGALR